MVVCEGCGRHVRSVDAACPFCEAPASSRPSRLTLALGAILTPVVLAACYGGAPDDTGCDDGDPMCDTDVGDTDDTDSDTDADTDT